MCLLTFAAEDNKIIFFTTIALPTHFRQRTCNHYFIIAIATSIAISNFHSTIIMLYLRNRKHFPCFHTVIETRVEVWKNELLVERVFPRNFESSQTSTCFHDVWEEKNVFYFFYQITLRKLKRANSVFYQSVNSPYRSRWRMRWRINLIHRWRLI